MHYKKTFFLYERTRERKAACKNIGKLRTVIQNSGSLLLDCLDGFDFQPEYPFSGLLGTDIDIQRTRHELIVTIPVNDVTIERTNTLITNYYFELILLYGDAATENGLRTESTDSEIIQLKQATKTVAG